MYYTYTDCSWFCPALTSTSALSIYYHHHHHHILCVCVSVRAHTGWNWQQIQIYWLQTLEWRVQSHHFGMTEFKLLCILTMRNKNVFRPVHPFVPIIISNYKTYIITSQLISTLVNVKTEMSTGWAGGHQSSCADTKKIKHFATVYYKKVCLLWNFRKI